MIIQVQELSDGRKEKDPDKSYIVTLGPDYGTEIRLRMTREMLRELQRKMQEAAGI